MTCTITLLPLQNAKCQLQLSVYRSFLSNTTSIVIRLHCFFYYFFRSLRKRKAFFRFCETLYESHIHPNVLWWVTSPCCMTRSKNPIYVMDINMDQPTKLCELLQVTKTDGAVIAARRRMCFLYRPCAYIDTIHF